MEGYNDDTNNDTIATIMQTAMATTNTSTSRVPSLPNILTVHADIAAAINQLSVNQTVIMS
jgi:hypothetical protein